MYPEELTYVLWAVLLFVLWVWLDHTMAGDE